MSKSQTSWTNSTETPVSWVVVGRTNTNWANGDIKTPAAYTVLGRVSTTWSNEAPVSNPYTYDSAVNAYDSSLMAYDFTMASSNQSNSKVPTTWSAA